MRKGGKGKGEKEGEWKEGIKGGKLRDSKCLKLDILPERNTIFAGSKILLQSYLLMQSNSQLLNNDPPAFNIRVIIKVLLIVYYCFM